MYTQISAFGDLHQPASAVLFSGGGGACVGIKAAGCQVLIAVNHDASAIEMHRANHPDTIHYREDVWCVPPTSRGRDLDLLWMSPACTHFSRARGMSGDGVLSEQSRSLADVAFPWVDITHPKVLILENVVEFQTWGPLLASGRPDPARKGENFRSWIRELEARGYTVSWRALCAADYGAPTTRTRLYLIARREGEIAWPEQTHVGRHAPARGCLDMDLPACRALAGRDEALDWSRVQGLPVPKRPLVGRTLDRIRAGLTMFGSEFLTVYYGNESDGQSLDVPLRTVTGKDRFGLVQSSTGKLEDATLRMLTPRELARCMGFPDSYVLTGSRVEQVARVGNAVCPPVAEALVRANVHRHVN